MSFDVVVVGAGAAGMMCAAQAGQRGRRVLLVDHRPTIGDRIRISGGGRCNFTNRTVGAEHYLSRNPHFCRSALARFTPRDFIDAGRAPRHPLPRTGSRAAVLRRHRAGHRRPAARRVRSRAACAGSIPARCRPSRRPTATMAAASWLPPTAGPSAARPSSSPPAASPSRNSARRRSGIASRSSSACAWCRPRRRWCRSRSRPTTLAALSPLAGVAFDAQGDVRRRPGAGFRGAGAGHAQGALRARPSSRSRATGSSSA